MAGKKSKKAKVSELKQKTIEIKPSSVQTEDEQKTAFDFGGLPPRDLKKNLGCG